MHGQFCAPFGSEITHSGASVLVEAQEISEYVPVQEDRVGVGVREVRGI